MSMRALVRRTNRRTGIPLEQLIPAPEITTARLDLATASETSESARRSGNNSCSVEARIASRGNVVVPMVERPSGRSGPVNKSVRFEVLCLFTVV